MEISASAGAAAEIRAIMARKNLKQVELAQAIGLSQSATSARLNGLQPLTINELVAIAQWIGVDAADILQRALREAA